MQPACGSQVSWVHTTPSSQSSGVPFTHSPVVGSQASPSSHAVPLELAGSEHAPVAGLQVPAVWHWSEAVQTTGSLPVHTPPSQVSVRVQASPSLHAVPSAFAGFEHMPLAGSQLPAM